METLAVTALMSAPVVTVTPTTTLPHIRNLMRDHGIRRLPVVTNGCMVGIVTLGDVRSACPSDATTLSIYELSYMLERVTAADIMRTGVISVQAATSVVAAAALMLEHKVSGLPVLDGEQLVGIITESDIFRAVVTGQLELPGSVTYGAAERRATTAHPIL
jgi:acetoin utilization protein AcuB